MERDPTLFPEWYKPSGNNGTSGGGASLNSHCRSSSNSDDRNSSWLHPKNRLLTSGLRRDKYESTAFDSLRRGSSSNGSVSHDKDVATHLRSSSSLGRSRRDGDSDRPRGRVLENGFVGSVKLSRAETDPPRRSSSSSSVSGQRADLLSRRQVKDVSNGAHSGGSRIASKASFERDFPSLGAEHNQGHDLRVSSTGPRTAFESLPIGPSAIGGGDGWTSSLAEIPAWVGSNGPVPSSSQTAPVSLPSTGLSASMAEALAQPPPQDRNAPQVSVDTRRIEELVRIQSTKLIPVMPSMSKHLILNSDKSKSKSANVSGLPKFGQQFSSQLSSARSATPKTPQAGNFQVLNRERNGILPAAKDGPNPLSRAPTPLTHVPSAAPLKVPIIPKAKADSKAPSAGEKRSSQARNRSAFFNSLRMKSAATEPSCVTSTDTVEACQQSEAVSLSSNQEDSSSLSRGLSSVSVDDSQEPMEFDDDLNDDEKAFLESLGWEKDAQVEVLTAEEIDAFVKEHGLVRQSSRLSHHDLSTMKTDAASSSNSQ